MSAPLVSVIMPVLNAERYVGEAIGSVAAQTLGDWELLIVDDGSSDASLAIARHQAARDPGRIRCFQHAGGTTEGASASRNLGLEHARGDYVAFLDADDVYLPSTLESQVAVLEAHPDAGATYGAAECWFSWTGRAEDRQRDYTPDLGVPTETLFAPPALLRHFLAKRAPVPCTCSLLVRRSALRAAGRFEPSFRHIYTDQVFYTKLFLHSAVYVTGGTLARYRQHAESCYSRVKAAGQSPGARHAYLEWVRSCFEERAVDDPLLLTTLNEELRRYEHPNAALGLRRRLRALLGRRSVDSRMETRS